MKAYLIAFKRLLSSLMRRVKRIEDNQILEARISNAKLDSIDRKLDQLLTVFSPKIVRELETLPETAEMVRNHDEWIRNEERDRRATSQN